MTGWLPLAGVQVLDASRHPAASSCSRLLGQLGASVSAVQPGTSAAHVRDLAATHDVVVTDVSHADERDCGPSVREMARPGGVVVAVADVEARLLGRVAAALTGAHAAVAALGALRWARAHGRVAWIETTPMEVIAACLGDDLPRALCEASSASGLSHDGDSLVLPCADGYVALTGATAANREHFAALMELESVPTAVDEWLSRCSLWLRSRTRREIFHAAQLWRLPVVPVLRAEEVPRDAHNAARGFWKEDPTGQSRPGAPFHLVERGDGTVRPAAPHPLPLSDVRVLDLGMVWAGPYAARLLGALGAQVVKVEGPNRRDGTRPAVDQGCAGVYADLNRGKSSLVLDLSSELGSAVFLRLVRAADVVLENFSPRVMPNFGLGYAALSAVNGRLVMVSLPAFGRGGPWEGYVAYGTGLELATGLAANAPGGRPAPARIAYLDYLSGCHAALAVLSALLARDADGRGAHVEVPQRDVACQLLDPFFAQGDSHPGWQWTAGELVEDPVLRARAIFASSPRGGAPCHHLARVPWRIHPVPAPRERPAPAFGTHTRRILRTWAGLDDPAIDRLLRRGVAVRDRRAKRVCA